MADTWWCNLWSLWNRTAVKRTWLGNEKTPGRIRVTWFIRSWRLIKQNRFFRIWIDLEGSQRVGPTLPTPPSLIDKLFNWHYITSISESPLQLHHLISFSLIKRIRIKYSVFFLQANFNWKFIQLRLATVHEQANDTRTV